MLGTSNLAKSFGDRTLFEGVSLKLNSGSRYGLVGANGSGKTTFLKIVAGDEAAVQSVAVRWPSGRLQLRTDGFAPQAVVIVGALP